MKNLSCPDKTEGHLSGPQVVALLVAREHSPLVSPLSHENSIGDPLRCLETVGAAGSDPQPFLYNLSDLRAANWRLLWRVYCGHKSKTSALPRV